MGSVHYNIPISCSYVGCGTKVNVRDVAGPFYFHEETSSATQALSGHCPHCGGILVFLAEGPAHSGFGREDDFKESPEFKLIYPIAQPRVIPDPEIPVQLRRDFNESLAVLPHSPKASAALNRRILQHVLREHFKIKERDLSTEIDKFIQTPGVPSHLSQAVDAVRNVGNFAAHPLKSTNTGEVVDVEPGEAEWLIEVIESLFDFAFIQPQRLAARKARLNTKLQSIGKPPMK
jgi:hypothetical protein